MQVSFCFRRKIQHFRQMRLLVAFCCCVSLCSEAQWVQQPDFPGGARDDAAVLNRRMSPMAFVGTGRDAGFNLTNDWYALEYAGGNVNWTPIAPLPATPRQYCTALGEQTTLLFGGQDAQGALNELWEYGPGSNTWNQRSSLPAPGRSACAAFFNADSSFAYVVGGILDSGQASGEVWRYEYLNDSWVQLSDFPGTPRHRAMYGDKGILAGGADSLFNPLADVWLFDFQSETWTQIDSLPYPLYGGSSITHHFDTYVAGGVTTGGVYNDSVILYNYSSGEWETEWYVLPSARKGGSMVISPSVYPLLQFGLGIDSSNTRFTDWWGQLIDLSVDEFRRESLTVYPNPTRGTFQLNGRGTLSVFNATGKLIQEQRIDLHSTVTFNAKPGSYTLVLKDDKGHFSRSGLVVIP